jgi:hypothetical protein
MIYGGLSQLLAARSVCSLSDFALENTLRNFPRSPHLGQNSTKSWLTAFRLNARQTRIICGAKTATKPAGQFDLTRNSLCDEAVAALETYLTQCLHSRCVHGNINPVVTTEHLMPHCEFHSVAVDLSLEAQHWYAAGRRPRSSRIE